MDTIICDITAFDYWRIPPIVQLLLAGNETDPVLTKLFKEETVLATREAMASSPLCQTWLRPNPATRNIGRAAKDLMPAISLLAASHRGPIDISVDDRTRCYTPGITRPRFPPTTCRSGQPPPSARTFKWQTYHLRSCSLRRGQALPASSCWQQKLADLLRFTKRRSQSKMHSKHASETAAFP